MKDRILEVGSSAPRFEGWGKVTGIEKYALDYFPENCVWAGTKRAGVAHGVIEGIDASGALQLPGVLTVLTRKDVPGTNEQGIGRKDQPVLAGDRVRHRGEAVALVIAEDRATLARALDRICVDITPLPGVFDPEEALKPGAPEIQEQGNILLKADVRNGDPEAAFERCHTVVEEVIEVASQDHAFLETQNGVAWMEPDGKLVLVVSTQAPFRDRFEIAHALGLEIQSIRVIAPFLGGGFGGKDGATVQCLLGLAAMHSGGRPVKMWWEREESFIAGYKRHGARLYYRLGASADGTLEALHCRLFYDTGPYAHLGAEVMKLGMEHAGGPYRIPNALIEGFCVHTNNPVSGAMRGFGVCQAAFAMERMMDGLASSLDMDPVELRRKNALRRGDRNCAGITMVHSTGILRCLDKLAQHPLWTERDTWKRKAPLFKRRGVGVAAVFNAVGYGRGLPDSAIAQVELTPEGRFRVHCGVPDMGQGNITAFVQIAGEILCQDASRIEVVTPDTDRTHASGSSAAGRTTYTFGNALIQACNELKTKLLHRAVLVLQADEERGLALLPGTIRHLPSGRDVDLALLGRTLPRSDRRTISQFVMPVAQDAPPRNPEFYPGFPHSLFSYAAHLARVEVDELTGKTDVVEYLAMTDGGRVINPQGFEQQVQGAVAQGIGYALTEELLLDHGHVVNPNLATYLIPTALDVPDVVSVPVETVEETGPYGMKGIGEVGMNGPLPAIAGAVEDATGRRLLRNPITPAHLLNAEEAPGPHAEQAAAADFNER